MWLLIVTIVLSTNQTVTHLASVPVRTEAECIQAGELIVAGAARELAPVKVRSKKIRCSVAVPAKK